MADKMVKPRHLVTSVSVPADQHIVEKEKQVTRGRGDEAETVATRGVRKGLNSVQKINEGKQAGGGWGASLMNNKKQMGTTVSTDPKTVNPEENVKKQKMGCLLAIVIAGLLAIVSLIILIQSTSNKPAEETGLPETSGMTEGEEQIIVQPVTDETNNLMGGDAETAMKLIFGVLGVAGLMWLLFAMFAFFTAKDQINKDKARRVLLPAAATFVILAVINGIIIAFFNQGGETTYTTSPIKIAYYSEWQASAPLDVEFDVSGFDEISDARFVSWDFGDGSKGSGAKVRHIFEGIGDFEVKVVFTMNDGETREYTRHVPVNNILPEIKLDASTLTGLAPLTVSLDASKTKDKNGTVVDFTWTFPNNVVKTGSVAEYTFLQKGEYDVVLQVTDNNSETVSETIKVIVTDEGVPLALITTKPDPAQGQIPLTVQFSGGGSGDVNGQIVRYEWNFGDGSPRENGQNAVHIFDQEGDFIVRLTVWDEDDLSGTNQIEVKALKKAVKPVPVITFTSGGTSGTMPFTVKLDGGESDDIDGEVISYQWDFGDSQPSALGQKVEHTYEEAGQYELVLTVTDSDGLSAEKKQLIKVMSPEPTPPVIEVTTEPDPPTVSVGDELRFDASRSYDLDGNIISYEWNFGDKTVRLGSATITHKYEKTGIYTVIVTAYDNDGKTTKKEIKVAISEPQLVAEITTDRDEGVVPLVVQFDTTTSVGQVETYEWSFGDGLKSSKRSPLHIFTEEGEYVVRLKVTDSTGMTSEDSIVITVTGK